MLRSTADAIDQLWKGLKTKKERKAVVDLINRLPTKTAIADENLDTVASPSASRMQKHHNLLRGDCESSIKETLAKINK